MNDDATTATQALRRRRLEALQRRATAHEGEARRLLELKQQQLLQAGHREASAAAQPPAASPLSALLAHIERHAAPAGLRAVSAHRTTWSRLHIDRQLQRALARVPGHAGPLNAERLTQQTLTLMRDSSPPYLQRFAAHLEALLWLDAAVPARVAPAPRKAPARGGRRAAPRRP